MERKYTSEDVKHTINFLEEMQIVLQENEHLRTTNSKLEERINELEKIIEQCQNENKKLKRENDKYRHSQGISEETVNREPLKKEIELLYETIKNTSSPNVENIAIKRILELLNDPKTYRVAMKKSKNIINYFRLTEESVEILYKFFLEKFNECGINTEEKGYLKKFPERWYTLINCFFSRSDVSNTQKGILVKLWVNSIRSEIYIGSKRYNNFYNELKTRCEEYDIELDGNFGLRLK